MSHCLFPFKYMYVHCKGGACTTTYRCSYLESSTSIYLADRQINKSVLLFEKFRLLDDFFL